MPSNTYSLTTKGTTIALVSSDHDIKGVLSRDSDNLFSWELKGVFIDWEAKQVIASYERTLPFYEWDIAVFDLNPRKVKVNR